MLLRFALRGGLRQAQVGRIGQRRALGSVGKAVLGSWTSCHGGLGSRWPTSTSRYFATTLSRQSAGESDGELSAKLSEELAYEQENSVALDTPDFVQDFLKSGIWKIEDMPKGNEVTLKRSFGNESIEVTWSIEDVNSMDDPEMEHAMSPATEGQGLPETAETAEEEETEDETLGPGYPVDLAITISKDDNPAAGALAIDAVTADGEITVTGIAHFDDLKLAQSRDPVTDWNRRVRYRGPEFSTLDPDLQNLFEEYLAERGIDGTLALFVPDYVDFKEEKEYSTWLQQTKAFIDA